VPEHQDVSAEHNQVPRGTQLFERQGTRQTVLLTKLGRLVAKTFFYILMKRESLSQPKKW
jgi:hypothetical protein